MHRRTLFSCTIIVRVAWEGLYRIGMTSVARLKADDTKRIEFPERGPDFLEVLARSIRVIDALGAHRHAPTISDLARATDLPKPTVRRVLHTLCALGYAEMMGRTFRLTPKIMRLATSYLGTSGNSRVLQDACDRLSEATGQSSLTGVLDGEDVLVTAYTMPSQLMATARGVGVRLPAFCTAAGRILLSSLTDERLNEFLKHLRPEKHTELTVVDKSRIKKEILQARERGYAWMDDEYTLGWKTVAYPLRRHDGTLYGTLSLNSKKTPGLSNREVEKFARLCAEHALALGPLLV